MITGKYFVILRWLPRAETYNPRQTRKNVLVSDLKRGIQPNNTISEKCTSVNGYFAKVNVWPTVYLLRYSDQALTGCSAKSCAFSFSSDPYSYLIFTHNFIVNVFFRHPKCSRPSHLMFLLCLPVYPFQIM